MAASNKSKSQRLMAIFSFASEDELSSFQLALQLNSGSLRL
jgi:hypothetical protein